MWRYHELLPVQQEHHVLTLGEGMTPLLPASHLVPQGLEGKVRLLVKDEGQNPTGSFKARGMAAAVSRALELGVRGVVIPTAGNAGAALAAYAARAGVPAYIVVPQDAPETCVQQARLYGAEVELIPGLISDAGQVSAEISRQRGWFNVSTLREPYRVEGKKTMGIELAEQLGWRLPDAIIFPTGGGTGIVGMWKAFVELQQLGWLTSNHLPKMIIVQAEGCARWFVPFTTACRKRNHGLQTKHVQKQQACACLQLLVTGLYLQAVRESGGTALTVNDDVNGNDGTIYCSAGRHVHLSQKRQPQLLPITICSQYIF